MWTSGTLAALAMAVTVQSADDPAARLQDRARQIEAEQDALSRIWPGYWPSDQPFVLYLPDTGAVSGGAAAADQPEFRPGPLEGVRFAYVLDYPSGAPNTVLLRLDDLEDDLSTLFHEQFHDYQTDAFRWIGEGGGEFVDLSGVADRDAFTVAIEGERRLLSQALTSKNPAERKRLVRQYLTARETRLAALPPGIRNAEDHREWTEGTADYAAVLAMKIIHPDGPDAVERLVSKLDAPLLGEWGSYLGAVFRGRAYGVGAAQAWLLDDLAVPDWRARIERGARMTALLDEALTAAGVDTAPAPPPIDPAVREDILNQLAALDAEPADRAAFLASRPHWLMLELTVPAQRVRDLTLSFGADHMSPLPDGSIALLQAREVVIGFGDFRVEARGRAALLDFNGDDGRMRFAIALSGEEEAVRLVTPGAQLDGLTLTLPEGLHPTLEAGQVVLRVMP